MLQGSYEKFQKQEPIRKTIHKDEITEETKAKLSNTRIWRMEFDFYNFVVKNFNLSKYHTKFSIARRHHIII